MSILALRPARRAVLVSSAVALFAAALPLVASADATSDSLSQGATYLAGIQGSYAGQQRVNPGPPGTVVNVVANPDVWEWEIGTGLAYFNTWGQTAIGLSSAAGTTGNAAGLAAVLAYADRLVADFADTGTFMRSQTRPQPSDIELLARLGGGGPKGCKPPKAAAVPKSARSAYALTASGWYLNNIPAQDEADRIIDGRIAQGNGDLAGWDVAITIRAALAVGDRAGACALANRVVARRGDWEGSSAAVLVDWWHAASEGGLAYALSLVQSQGDASCANFSAIIREYRDALIARQSGPNLSPFTGLEADGSIEVLYGGDSYWPTQQNAFAVLGLIGCCDTATAADKAAAARIAGYLLRVQYAPGTGAVITYPAVDPRPADGGWASYPYYSQDDANGEIVGEALQALAVAKACGVKPTQPAAVAPAMLAKSQVRSGLVPLELAPSERPPSAGREALTE